MKKKRVKLRPPHNDGADKYIYIYIASIDFYFEMEECICFQNDMFVHVRMDDDMKLVSLSFLVLMQYRYILLVKSQNFEYLIYTCGFVACVFHIVLLRFHGLQKYDHLLASFLTHTLLWCSLSIKI